MFVVRMFLTESYKGILFGVWELLQDLFRFGKYLYVKKNRKNNLTHFAWCSTSTYRH